MSTTMTTTPTNASTTMSGDEQVVVLRVRAIDYAVSIGQVQEIVRVPTITPMPGAGFGVKGIINLRGRILPVIDLAERLGLEWAEQSREARVVVVDSGSEGVGLLVDGVSEVLPIRGDAVVPPSPMTVGAGTTTMVRGVAKLGERLVLLLELDAAIAG